MARPAAGYTIIEIIVVLAIVLILLALLFPALGEVLGQVRILQCQHQLRQIGAAYRQYLSDSGGVWPPILCTDAPPLETFRQIEADTGLRMAPSRPAAGFGQPGPHWSIVLWPHLHDLAVYTCPADPQAGVRGKDLVKAPQPSTLALQDAPPESYALNVILFRTNDTWRRMAGCTWGTDGKTDYNDLWRCTTAAEQRRQFPGLNGRILMFCGAAGQTVGSQFNVPLRTGGFAERWEWHPRQASAAYADEPGCGSNYLFVDGHVEYRDECPSLWEWGYDLGVTPSEPRPRPKPPDEDEDEKNSSP
jgi:prepilin-type processing-associated H-X9-DG protein/prepilin-type N-terminal cleavage/methylation domain-containing protein